MQPHTHTSHSPNGLSCARNGSLLAAAHRRSEGKPYSDEWLDDRASRIALIDVSGGLAMQRWRAWNSQKLPGRAVNRYVKGWVQDNALCRNALTAIEVHRTACIVTHPPGGEDAKQVLINPGNETLAGTRFTPEQCWKELHGDPTTGRWSEDLAVYPHQSIDGLVTEFGGDELRVALEALPQINAHGHRCPAGGAVVTEAYFELRELYGALVHAVAPMYRLLEHAEWKDQLLATYHAAFDASERSGAASVAVPLLGAGARGAPTEAAMQVAAEAAVSWRSAAGGETTLTARFGVQDSTTAHALVAAVDAAAARNVCQTDSGNGADNADDAAPGAVFLAAPPPPKGRWEL